MTPIERWERASRGFGDRVEGTAAEDWDLPSPCEGWAARDVVRHLVEWVPPFLAQGAGVTVEVVSSPDEDPAASWRELDTAIRDLLDTRGDAARFSHPQAGDHPLDQAIDRFVTGDVVIHTWDLARATGQDERLDPELVAEQLAGMEPMADVLASSGHYSPAVPVEPDADPQTRLIAVTGRVP